VPVRAPEFERHVRDCFATERNVVPDDVMKRPVL
jgi:hypothetical protein